MYNCVNRREVGGDVFTVQNGFYLSMRENESHYSLEHIEHDKPVPMALDCFGGLCMSKSELKIPKGLCRLVVGNGGMDP